MPQQQLTILGRTLAVMYDQLDQLGFDRAETLREAGLSESDFENPDARIPVRKVMNTWRALSRRAPGRPLGLILGSTASSRALGLVGYTMHYSDSLRRAFQRFVRYSHILAEMLEPELRVEAETERLILGSEPEAIALRHPVDLRLALGVALARELTGKEVVPLEACFAYAEPPDTSEHRRFFRCPLRFGWRESGVAFRRGDLDLPVLQGDETLTGYLEQLAEGILKSRSEARTFADEVERVIWARLSGGQPTVERVAAILGHSARTLQRRLRAEGRSFAAILEGVRRRASRRLLESRELAVYEVAYLLGYSEPSTFHRAFRRWHGAAPNEYRRQAQEREGAAGSV